MCLLAAAPPAPHGTGGAVASDAALATRAGLDLLRAGGNAVDAAVGTALALAVVYPEAGNLGGGGFALVRMHGELAALDFREVAPAGATRSMYLDERGEPRPDASTLGPLAAGVPGSPAGYFELHRRYGKLPWKKVVEPAMKLASYGFPAGVYLSRSLDTAAPRLRTFPETTAFWLRDGAAIPRGTLIRQPDLARTLAAYAERGPEAITSGEVARAIEESSRRHGGILTAADLAAYRPEWRTPLRFQAFGWELASMPLPSSGGFILAESLSMLEQLHWKDAPRFGAERAHLLAEVLRRAFVDRIRLGAPGPSGEATGTPLEELLAPDRLAARLAAISRERATSTRDLATADGVLPKEGNHTTHLSVIDAEGNLVALTSTLNDVYGCGLWVPGAGFFLNNEMDDFATAPGRPNLFGLIQGEANAVQPGKRMLSSMSPTLAWRGEEALVLGGRGGSLIPTHTLQVLLNLIIDSDPLQAAVNRPRLHHQGFPDELQAEADTLAPETAADLQRRGHTIVINTTTAKVNTARRNPDGTLEAAAEPRNDATAGVVNAWER